MTYYLNFGYGSSQYEIKNNVNIDEFCYVLLEFMKELPLSGYIFIFKKHQLENLKECLIFENKNNIDPEIYSKGFEYCLTKYSYYDRVKICNSSEIMLGEHVKIHQNDVLYKHKEMFNNTLMN